jgi:hypothetical protein
LFAAISLIELMVSSEILGSLECTLDLCFGEHTEKLTMPAQKGLRLDDEERMFPGLNHPGQKYQENPVRLPVDRSFDLSTKDDQLLS